VAHAAGKFDQEEPSPSAEQIVRVAQALDSWPAQSSGRALRAEALLTAALLLPNLSGGA
jgi:hypothetical protein